MLLASEKNASDMTSESVVGGAIAALAGGVLIGGVLVRQTQDTTRTEDAKGTPTQSHTSPKHISIRRKRERLSRVETKTE
jgi:hypothetical protein